VVRVVCLSQQVHAPSRRALFCRQSRRAHYLAGVGIVGKVDLQAANGVHWHGCMGFKGLNGHLGAHPSDRAGAWDDARAA
jgi:hypothetical protein